MLIVTGEEEDLLRLRGADRSAERHEQVKRTSEIARESGSPARGRPVRAAVLCLGLAGLALSPGAAGRSLPARWRVFLHVPAVVDLTGRRSDGSLTVAAGGRLSILRIGAPPSPFARAPDGYSTALGPEPYIALAGNEAVDGAACSFRQDDLYALEPNVPAGVIEVDAQGRARRIADLESGVSPNGIAFDDVGRFGHRLLVTAGLPGGTALFAMDCAGRVSAITRRAPRLEGGIAVAPSSFGEFGGDLVAPDEYSGRIVAIDPQGNVHTLTKSGLPSGADTGVESAGFVPSSLGRGTSAYLADRHSPGNAHPGTDSILRLSGGNLIKAGVRPGDLLVASEGGAKTIAVRCARKCSVRHIADGPAVTHAEGHIVFAQGP
jgi:hypothetical protein